MGLMSLLSGKNDRRSLRRRRAVVGLEGLEARKLLSTVPGGSSSGTFDGMAWIYNYDANHRTGSLTITDQPGNHTIDITAAHPNLSPSDPGYDPAHVNDITGILLTDRQNSLQGGPDVVPGTQVNVVVQRRNGDDTFVNREPSFTMTTTVRSVTTTPPTTTAADQSGKADEMAWSYHYSATSNSWNLVIIDRPGSASVRITKVASNLRFTTASGAVFDGPVLPSGSNVGGHITVVKDATDKPITNGTGYSMTTESRTDVQTGTTLGLDWRYVRDQSTSNGTLYIQDKVGLAATYIGQTSTHMTFNRTGVAFEGPAVTNGTPVKIVVAKAAGDSPIWDDRNGANNITAIPRTQTGQQSNGATWVYNYDAVHQTGQLTITSVAAPRRAPIYHFTVGRVNKSPGDPGYTSDYNPINQIVWLNSGNEQYGVNIEVGTQVSITVKSKSTDFQYQNDEPTFAIQQVNRA